MNVNGDRDAAPGLFCYQEWSSSHFLTCHKNVMVIILMEGGGSRDVRSLRILLRKHLSPMFAPGWVLKNSLERRGRLIVSVYLSEPGSCISTAKTIYVCIWSGDLLYLVQFPGTTPDVNDVLKHDQWIAERANRHTFFNFVGDLKWLILQP